MKSIATGAFSMAAVLCPVAASAVVEQYQNPLPVKIADPSVMKTDAGEYLYYLSGTSAARYGSNDLVHWQKLDDWIDFDDWSIRRNIWAAEAVEYNGRFYYHFSALGSEEGSPRRTYVAVADSPDATFRPHSAPLWEDDFTWIDSHVFIDNDDTPWLFVTNDSKKYFDNKARIYAVELKPDFTGIKGEPTFLIEPDQAWEHAWQEGAAVLRHNDVYYMTWSSELFQSDRYSIGYATATHPLGPWTKADENPILSQRITTPDTIGYAGPGHNGFVRSPDGTELFAVYHTRRNSPGGGARQLGLDRVRFIPRDNAPDRMVIADGAPSRTAQGIPSGAKPMPRALGDDFDGEELDLDRWPAVWGPDLRWVSMRDGALQVIALPTDVHETQTGGANILLQYPPQGDQWTITTRVRFTPEENFEHAFLTVWRDSNNYMMLKSVHAHGRKYEAAIELAEEYESRFLAGNWSEDSWLRIRRVGGNRYVHEVSADGEQWRQVGDELHFPHEHVMVGLGAARPGSERRLVVARFDFFRAESTGSK